MFKTGCGILRNDRRIGSHVGKAVPLVLRLSISYVLGQSVAVAGSTNRSSSRSEDVAR